ncbi:unnamed protein product [Amoebophrya sp. A25]|nr:unnamed protein product [Amoebophrya sp. A25]|eukprot:GSA25T00000670001.1
MTKRRSLLPTVLLRGRGCGTWSSPRRRCLVLYGRRNVSSEVICLRESDRQTHWATIRRSLLRFACCAVCIWQKRKPLLRQKECSLSPRETWERAFSRRSLLLFPVAVLRKRMRTALRTAARTFLISSEMVTSCRFTTHSHACTIYMHCRPIARWTELRPWIPCCRKSLSRP